MGKWLMGEWLWLKPWFQGITSNLKIRENTTKNVQETLETLKASQLELELKSQSQYLDEQITEMWVSKDAMWKYPTFKWIPTLLMYVLTSILIGYLWYEWSKYILSNQTDKGPQQEEVVNGIQENIQDVLIIDTTRIIDDYKKTLSKDELEEFKQFSKEEQRRFATEK